MGSGGRKHGCLPAGPARFSPPLQDGIRGRPAKSTHFLTMASSMVLLEFSTTTSGEPAPHQQGATCPSGQRQAGIGGQVGLGGQAGMGALTLQPEAEPVHRPKGPSQAQQVGGEVGPQQVQEARGTRREVEAPALPLAPEQAGAGQRGQQQQPEEQHGWRPGRPGRHL